MKQKFRILMGFLMILAFVVTAFSCKKETKQPETTITPITSTSCDDIVYYSLVISKGAQTQDNQSATLYTRVNYGDTLINTIPNYKRSEELYNGSAVIANNINYNFTQKRNEGFELVVDYLRNSAGYAPLTFKLYKNNNLIFDTLVSAWTGGFQTIYLTRKQFTCQDSLWNN